MRTSAHSQLSVIDGWSESTDGARSWAVGGGPDPDGLRVLGELDFGAGLSSNMVRAENNVLVVAAGSGGVKLVTMQAR